MEQRSTGPSEDPISNTPQVTRRAGRREFLAKAAAIPVLAMSWPRAAMAANEVAEPAGTHPGLIQREREPVNLEFPFPTLDGAIVPNHRFFVRSHFRIPKIDVAKWTLKVDGHVEKELELSYEQLRKLPSKTITTTIECAGNSRGFLIPKAKGLLWEFGGIGTAKWTGVPLATVLEQAGLKEGAVDVVLEGTDQGEINDDPKSPGPIHFERSIPIAKAKRPEVLLAWEMNGEPLPVKHGFPLRAVVSGWYGMASVKWLSRVTVMPRHFQGYWQTSAYAYWQREGGRPTLVPVTAMGVKAAIARPCLQEIVPAGKPYRIHGAAWAGESNVAKVEVSTDGGRSWQLAKLLGESVPFAWQLWETEWQVPKEKGTRQLMARATDTEGRVQPMSHDRDHGAYEIRHVVPVEVEVR